MQPHGRGEADSHQMCTKAITVANPHPTPAHGMLSVPYLLTHQHMSAYSGQLRLHSSFLPLRPPLHLPRFAHPACFACWGMSDIDCEDSQLQGLACGGVAVVQAYYGAEWEGDAKLRRRLEVREQLLDEKLVRPFCGVVHDHLRYTNVSEGVVMANYVVQRVLLRPHITPREHGGRVQRHMHTRTHTSHVHAYVYTYIRTYIRALCCVYAVFVCADYFSVHTYTTMYICICM
jgi:hypothetical protein